MSDGGKGSAPRPFSVSAEQFASNWDKIFTRNKVNPTAGEDGHIIQFQTVEPQPGDLRINSVGAVEQYREQYWTEAPRQGN